MDILNISIITMSIISFFLFGYFAIKVFLLWRKRVNYKSHPISKIDNYLLIKRLKEK